MRISDVVNQLKAVLPKYTDDFSTVFSVSSLTRSSSTVTATTTTPHGLLAGNKVLITSAKTPILLSSLTRINGYALAICATKHNLTKANETVEISGANQTLYNGSHNLVWSAPKFQIRSITIDTNTLIATVTTSQPHGFVVNANFEVQISGTYQSAYNIKTAIATVPTSTTFTIANVYGANEDGEAAPAKLWQVQQALNAYTFIYEVDTAAVTPATGTIYQVYEYLSGYNGYKTILTVPSTTTLTYAIDSTPLSPARGTIYAKTSPNVTGAISLERAIDFYVTNSVSGQSKKWIIVTMGPRIFSKSNFNLTDANTYNGEGDIIREMYYQDINLYLFLPGGSASDELLYIATADAANDYFSAICHSLLGFIAPSGLSESTFSRMSPTITTMNSFAGSYYVYQVTFQATNYINQEDAIAPADLSAFRIFDFDVLSNTDNSTVVMNINAQVDEED